MKESATPSTQVEAEEARTLLRDALNELAGASKAYDGGPDFFPDGIRHIEIEVKVGRVGVSLVVSGSASESMFETNTAS